MTLQQVLAQPGPSDLAGLLGFPLMSIALVNCSHDCDQTPDEKLTFKGDTAHCGSRNVRLLITLHSQ